MLEGVNQLVNQRHFEHGQEAPFPERRVLCGIDRRVGDNVHPLLFGNVERQNLFTEEFLDRGLKIVAAGSILTAYLIISFLNVVDGSLFGLLGTAAAFYLAINKF